MSKKNEIATTSKNTAVGMPFDYGEDAGVGVDITMDDLRLPLVVLPQTESKVLREGHAKFVPGGAPGKILNTATKEYYDGAKGMLLVPAMIKTSVIEWLPNNQGFVAEHDVNSEIALNARANGNKRGDNDLVKTKTMVAVRLDEETMEPIDFVVIPFSASKLAAWSDYFTSVNSAKATKNAPLFAQTVRLITHDDENKEGKRYKNYAMFAARNEAGELIDTSKVKNKADAAKLAGTAAVITSLIGPDTAAFLAAKQLREQVMSGAAQIDHAQAAEGSSDEGGHF